MARRRGKVKQGKGDMLVLGRTLLKDYIEDEPSQLLVEVAINTGMRWGELIELRKKDFDATTNVFTVARAVVMRNRKFHPEGKRFLVKDYPKERKYRRIKVDAPVGARIAAHIRRHGLGNDDFLFWYVNAEPPPLSPLAGIDIAALGFTERTESGRTYPHGTTNGYTAGECRCRYCRAAMADYRRERRRQGRDDPRQGRTWDTDGHIPGQWFRNRVIRPALRQAAIPVDLRMHRVAAVVGALRRWWPSLERRAGPQCRERKRGQVGTERPDLIAEVDDVPSLEPVADTFFHPPQVFERVVADGGGGFDLDADDGTVAPFKDEVDLAAVAIAEERQFGPQVARGELTGEFGEHEGLRQGPGERMSRGGQRSRFSAEEGGGQA